MNKPKKFLLDDREHANQTHYRWHQLNTDEGIKAYIQGKDDQAMALECFACQYYVFLQGKFSKDWGVCSNPASPYDRHLMYEHHGCEYHSQVDDDQL
jgi:hypothetical protein